MTNEQIDAVTREFKDRIIEDVVYKYDTVDDAMKSSDMKFIARDIRSRIRRIRTGRSIAGYPLSV